MDPGVIKDDAGNNFAGISGTTYQFNSKDITAPNAPSITSGTTTNDSTPTITGTADANSTVTLTVPNNAKYTTTATGGNWSIDTQTATPASGLLSLNVNGNNSISVIATDSAGNVSGSTTQTLIIDTTPPTINTYNPSQGGTLSSNSDNIILTFNESIVAGTGNIVLLSHIHI